MRKTQLRLRLGACVVLMAALTSFGPIHAATDQTFNAFVSTRTRDTNAVSVCDLHASLGKKGDVRPLAVYGHVFSNNGYFPRMSDPRCPGVMVILDMPWALSEQLPRTSELFEASSWRAGHGFAYCLCSGSIERIGSQYKFTDEEYFLTVSNIEAIDEVAKAGAPSYPTMMVLDGGWIVPGPPWAVDGAAKPHPPSSSKKQGTKPDIAPPLLP